MSDIVCDRRSVADCSVQIDDGGVRIEEYVVNVCLIAIGRVNQGEVFDVIYDVTSRRRRGRRGGRCCNLGRGRGWSGIIAGGCKSARSVAVMWNKINDLPFGSMTRKSSKGR